MIKTFSLSIFLSIISGVYCSTNYNDSTNYLLMQSRKNPTIYNYVIEGANVKIVDTTYNFNKGKLIIINDSTVAVQSKKNDSVYQYHVGQIYMIKYNNKTRKKTSAVLTSTSVITGIIGDYYNRESKNVKALLTQAYLSAQAGFYIMVTIGFDISSLVLINKRAVLTKYRDFKKVKIANKSNPNKDISQYLKIGF